MSCCILYNEPGPNALPDELDIIEQVEYVEMHLHQMNISTYRKGITTNFMNELAELKEAPPEFIFNLAESINNKGELLYFVPAVLNMYSIPYTGNPLEAMFITTSKWLTYRMLVQAGLNAPKAFLPSQASMLETGKKYIIKPIWEDGSMGITADSVFIAGADTSARLSAYRDTHWFVQEFIDGREFNISVMMGKNGPEVLPPAEMTFRNYGDDRPKIVDFKAKWEEGSFEFKNTVRKFPGKKLDTGLESKLRELALGCWHVFGLKGYARVDMRVDNNNIPYAIEVNANPCISPNGGFAAATHEAGYKFTDVLQWIIDDMNR
ncbi:MAG TPA: ATP-grasp domain-containing protein [Bacteroidales bacterium]|nr:ATP-grasp domain-containing protein [Bacteroidales bacterium]